MSAKAGSRLGAVAIFAAAMGWLEAVVVVYIRGLLGFPHGGPVPPPEQWMPRLGAIPWLVSTEQGREAATLVMLAAAGWMAAPGVLARLGAFLVAFGVWDIVYYVALRVLIGWPESLATKDLLFLIPPSPLWVQPVWVPIAISCGFIAGGVALARRGRG